MFEAVKARVPEDEALSPTQWITEVCHNVMKTD